MTQEEQPSTTPAMPAPKRSGVGKWTLLIIIGIIPVLAIGLNARAIYRYGRAQYARYCASQGLKYMESQQWLNAMKALSDANRHASDDPEVMRATVTFLKRTSGDPRSLVQTLKRLIGAGHGTSEDYLTLAKAHLALAEVVEARQLYSSLSPEQQNSKDGLELLAQVLRAEGHTLEAEQTLRRALSFTPDDPESKLRLALLDYNNTFPEVQNRARQTMWDLVGNPSETGLAAMSFLTRDRNLSSVDANRLLKAVESNPKATLNHRLDVLSAIMRASPQRRDEILSAEVERNKGKKPSELVEVVAWLAREKQHTRILQLIPPQVAMQSQEVFPFVAQALTEEGRWGDLRRMLTGGDKLPVPPARVQVWLAQAAVHLNPADRATPRQHLENAAEIAGRANDMSSLSAAAQVAEQQGIFDLAIRSYERIAAANPNIEIETLEKIYELSTHTRDTPRLVQISAKLQDLRPTSGIFRDRVHYLSLLTGSRMETSAASLSARDAESVVEGQTARVPASFLRALAAYRFRDHDSMQSALGSLIGQLEHLSPGQRAVAAGLLRSAGREIEAFRLRENVNEALLLPEELALLGRNW